MKYELTDYNGKSITVTDEQAAKVASKAGLLPIKVGNQIHYLNPSNIASIKPRADIVEVNDNQIDAPDYRGQDSAAKDKIREMLKKKDMGGMR
jgi:hypothetical protein